MSGHRQTQAARHTRELGSPAPARRSSKTTRNQVTHPRNLYALHLLALWFVLAQTGGAPYQLPSMPSWPKERGPAALGIIEIDLRSRAGNHPTGRVATLIEDVGEL